MTSAGNEVVTVVLGNEWDAELGAALRRALGGMGAVQVEGSWGVGGSQEVSSARWSLEGVSIQVEAETYVGLSVTAPKPIIDRIRAALGRSPGRE